MRKIVWTYVLCVILIAAFAASASFGQSGLSATPLRSHSVTEIFASLAPDFRSALLALATACLCILIIVVARLRSAKDRLAELNRKLESNLNERTAQLSRALREVEDKQLQLLHVSKMAALGQIAGGIAHEINSPLAAVSLNAELITQILGSEHPAVPRLNSVLNAVERISKIISGIRRFTQGASDAEFQKATVGELITDTLSLCAERLKKSSVTIRWEKSGNEIALNCRPEQISQVLLNLINNAVEAVGASSEKWIRLSTELNQGRVKIFVDDSGPGVLAEHRTMVMLPFFTTKEPGKGAGLGLSIAQGIMKAHSGALTLDDTQPKTRFILDLPEAA